MKVFIYLVINVSVIELCWFKDVILDVVIWSLIGCEDLWFIVVEMVVVLVI